MKRAIKLSDLQRGAVTVFLTLVLVPCIIFVCAFGDVSRVQLSKARAASAADLAMYSLLANYDEDLKEYYGIVSSCQDIDQYFDETAKYFKGMMAASGMDDTGSELLIQYLSALRSGNITDFLQVEMASDIKVSTAENGAVAGNPALIEDGIVEFMKYRGPIEIVKKVVDRFKDLGDSDDYKAADEAPRNQEVAEAKTEAAEAEGELLENALYSYMAMRQYEDLLKSKDVPSISKYNQYANDVKLIWDDFHSITELITKYYAGTNGITLLSFPSFSLSRYKYKPKNVGNKVTDESGSTKYCINKKILKNLLKNVDSNVNSYKSARKRIVDACSGLPSSVDVSSGINDVRYALAVQKAVSSSDLSTMDSKGDALMKSYAKLNAALDCDPYPEDDDLPNDWKSQIRSALNSIRNMASASESSSYSTISNNYNTTAKDRGAVSNVQNCRYEFYSKLVGGNATIGRFNDLIKEKFSQVYNELDQQDKTLTILLKGGKITYNGTEYKVKSLSQLLALAEEYGQKRDTWGRTAHGAGTDYGDKEYATYTDSSKAGESTVRSEELAKGVNAQSVRDMISRLTNIQGDIRQLRDSLKNFTYGGLEATHFNGRKNIIDAACREIGDNQSLYLSENESAAAGYSAKLIRPNSKSILYPGVQLLRGPVGNEPDISKDCELYAFLDKSLDKLDEIEKGTKKAKKQMEEFKGKGEDAKKNANKVEDKYLKGRGKEPLHTTTGGSQFSETSVVLGIIDTVKRLGSGNFGEIRDRIYVCEYAMDMFSYSTFNNEGEYHLTGDKYKFKDFTDAYPGSWDAWNKEDAANLYENQSLTNVPINKKNNAFNLAEVEYLLYGDKSADENLKKTYGAIFRIRMAMNMASGFVNFYDPGNGETAMAIELLAQAIFAATAGIVPVPLTKCVFIGVLAAMESAKDMEFLKAGQPVDVYKKDESRWVYSLAVKETEVQDLPIGAQPDKTKFSMYYSDYLYLFLYSAVTNDSTYSSVLNRIGDLIEANMRKHNGEFVLSKSRSYFKLSGQLRVKPLLLTLPIVDAAEGVEDLRQNTDWCTYKVDTVRGYS